MSAHASRRQSAVICKACLRDASRQSPRRLQAAAVASTPAWSSAILSHYQARWFTQTARRVDSAVAPLSGSTTAPAALKKGEKQDKSLWGNQWTVYSATNAALVKRAQALGNAILSSNTIPSESQVVESLRFIESAAQQLTVGSRVSAENHARDDSKEIERNAVSMLLDLDRKQAQEHPVSISIALDSLSTLAYNVITHPPVFLTPVILQTYVSIQSVVQRPASFPEVFYLYAHKPVPVPGTSNPIQYRQQNSDSVRQAIPVQAANAALDLAVNLRSMEVALGIIDTTYATHAFRRNKFIRKALPAISGLSLSPFAAYIAGISLVPHTHLVDPSSVTVVTFFGIMAYITSVSILGFVAITTRNDQMERVSWVVGTPLRERWLREEERAAVDKVACSWGFKDASRRGEEEGETWIALKEWAALRGMEIDRTELMEGME